MGRYRSQFNIFASSALSVIDDAQLWYHFLIAWSLVQSYLGIMWYGVLSFWEQKHLSNPLFCRLQDEDFTPCNFVELRKELAQYFSSSSFIKEKGGSMEKEQISYSGPSNSHDNDPDSKSINLFVIPLKDKDDSLKAQYKSYISALWKLRDQVPLLVSYGQVQSHIFFLIW